MSKKILIICNSSTGLNDFRGMLIDELLKRKYEIIAIIPKENNEIELDAEECLRNRGCKLFKVDITRRGKNPLKDIALFNNYLHAIKKIHPDLVITYTIKPNIYGGIACRILKIPYAVNITGLGSAFENDGLVKKIVTVMSKIAYKQAKVVFFENEGNRQFFVDQKIIKKAQTKTLNGAGVDLNKFKIKEYKDSDITKFLFIGRVMKEKGIDELFGAMKKLIEDGIKCELDVLGGCEEDYKKEINEYERQGWLHYYGYQKDVRPFIDQCHCFVLPSWHEGMANTNLECAASGRPVITSNIHGCMESVEDGITGYLTECKKEEQLYNTMKKFTMLPYEKRKEMGIAGRIRMEKIFDKKKVIAETISYME